MSSPDLKVVFIELGRIPKHLSYNISRLYELFPDISIVLITDQVLNHSLDAIDKRCEIVNVKDKSEENSLQLMNLIRFKNSKDAFWIYTTQRLIELCDYHLANPENLILHVESDVILMEDFPFEHLQQHNRMLWGNCNSTHDVASLLFLPNAKLTAKFKKLILHFLIEDQSVSDMTLLSIIARQLPDDHSYFPSIPSDNSILINAAYAPKDFELESQSRLFESFGGVFDHQMVGMYLDGLNPEQTYGFKETLFTKVVESGESLIDPRYVNYELKTDSRLVIHDTSSAFPLYTLHLHSKSLDSFEIQNLTLRKRIEDANLNKKFTHFNLTLFVSLVLRNIHKGTFLPWTKNLFIYSAEKLKIFISRY